MTPTYHHLRGGEHVTIIRAPGDPMPAWLGGGCPERIALVCLPDRIAASQSRAPFIWFGEDITLPSLEDQA